MLRTVFGKSQKSPQDLVRALREGLTALTKETGEKKLDKVIFYLI